MKKLLCILGGIGLPIAISSVSILQGVHHNANRQNNIFQTNDKLLPIELSFNINVVPKQLVVGQSLDFLLEIETNLLI